MIEFTQRYVNDWGCLHCGRFRHKLEQAQRGCAEGRLLQDHGSAQPGRRMVMSVFKKQGVYWIDYYVNGHRKRERIGPDKQLAEAVLRKHNAEK
jgi:beta-lactamase superfamily II metal-dependent hydrolase